MKKGELQTKKDAILKRFSMHEYFLGLQEIEKNRIIDSFLIGHFDWSSSVTNSSGRTFIRAKKESFDINKHSDSDLSFWFGRILEKPLITIIANK